MTRETIAESADARALSEEEIERFVERGYLVVRGAVTREAALRFRDEVMKGQDERAYLSYRPDRGARIERPIGELDLRDPSTWYRPSLSLHTGRELPLEAFAPKLHAAVTELCAPRVIRRQHIGQFWKLNAEYHPGPDPGPDSDAHPRGWHIDSPKPPTRLDGRTDALVVLLLWSDVGPGEGGTRFRPATLDQLVERLEQTPEGVDVESPAYLEELWEAEDEILEVTGAAGDAIVTHAWVFHSRSNNYGAKIRVLENPMISVTEPLEYSPHNPSPSPVERCVITRLNAPRRGRVTDLRDGAQRVCRARPGYAWPFRSALGPWRRAEDRAWLQQLDAALLATWAATQASKGAARKGTYNAMAHVAHLVDDLLVRPDAAMLESPPDDDPDAGFAALLGGATGPATRARITSIAIAATGLEVEIADGRLVRARADGEDWLVMDASSHESRPHAPNPVESDAAYAPVTSPDSSQLRDLLAAAPPVDEAAPPEPGFDRYLRVRLEHVIAPAHPPRVRYRDELSAGAGAVTRRLAGWFGTPTEQRRRGGVHRVDSPDEPVLARLAPPPSWLRELADDGVTDARVARRGRRLYVEARGRETRRFVVDPRATDAVEQRAGGEARRPEGARALVRRHRSALVGLTRRICWVEGLVNERPYNRYTPSATEEALAALHRWALLRGPRPAPSGIDEVDAFARELERLDVLTSPTLTPQRARAAEEIRHRIFVATPD